MADVKWIKIPTDFLDGPIIKHIETLPNKDKIIVFLLHLICESAKNGKRKLIFKISDKVEITDDVLIAVFGFDKVFIKEAISLFKSLGIVEIKYNQLEVFKFWVPARNRSSLGYQEWRLSVFSRDNFTCKKCGTKGGVLNAHHIKQWSKYPSLRYEISNGITLCEQCHKDLHKELRKNGAI